MEGRRMRWLMLALMIVAMTGCGTTFFYNRLDTLARWELESYIDLSEEQEDFVRTRFAAHLDWHRDHELPRYSAWLRELDADLALGLDRAKLDHHIERFHQFRQDLAVRLLPDITRFLAGLSDAQTEELFAALEEDNEEFAEEYVELPEDKLLKKRLKELRESLRKRVGPLNPEQSARLETWTRETPLSSADQLVFQRDWQQALREALLYRQDGERFRARLGELFLEPEKLRTPAFQAKVERYIDQFRTLLVELDRSFTEKQRARLRDEVQDFIEDFEGLSKG